MARWVARQVASWPGAGLRKVHRPSGSQGVSLTPALWGSLGVRQVARGGKVAGKVVRGWKGWYRNW